MTLPFVLLALSLEPLTLQRALELVEAQNPDVVLARLAAQEAGVSAQGERSALLPQLSVQAGAAYQTSSLGAIGLGGLGFPLRIGPYRVLDARPQVEQTVLDLARWSAWKAARLRQAAAGREVQVRVEAAKLAVAEVYLDALQSESRARAAESRLKQAKELLTQVEDAWRAGTANRLDVARAAQRVETEQTALLLAARDRQVLATQLLRAIGLPQQPETTLAEVFAAVEATGGTRPELALIEDRGSVLREELRQAERDRWPKASAFGNFGVLGSSFVSGASTYTAGVQVSIPVWTGGRIESGMQRARIRLEQWREEKRRLQLQISQEEAQALVERDTAVMVIESARRSAEAAREALEMARLRYSAGMTANLDLVTAQSNLALSEESEIQARYDRLRAEVRLARARGNVSGALVR